MNEYKNDIKVAVGGVEFVLRPTFGCVAAIEAETAKPLLKLAEEIGNNTITAIEVKAIIKEGVKASKTFTGDEPIEQAIMTQGLASTAYALIEFFNRVFYGAPEEPQDEVKKSPVS